MVRSRLRRDVRLLFAAAIILMVRCATISNNSELAYQNAMALKSETLALMSKATEPYDKHVTEVKNLMQSIEEESESARERSNNHNTVHQWEILKDPDGGTVGGFMKMWRERAQLSEAIIDAAKGVVADAFDRITELEKGKPSDAGYHSRGGD